MTAKAYCVHCGKQVSEFTADCPHCGKPTANKDAPTQVKDSPATWKTASQKKNPVPFMVITAVLLITAGAIVFLLK
jgi:uncharacterized membrane protein YvbJ